MSKAVKIVKSFSLMLIIMNVIYFYIYIIFNWRYKNEAFLESLGLSENVFGITESSGAVFVICFIIGAILSVLLAILYHTKEKVLIFISYPVMIILEFYLIWYMLDTYRFVKYILLFITLYMLFIVCYCISKLIENSKKGNENEETYS